MARTFGEGTFGEGKFGGTALAEPAETETPGGVRLVEDVVAPRRLPEPVEFVAEVWFVAWTVRINGSSDGRINVVVDGHPTSTRAYSTTSVGMETESRPQCVRHSHTTTVGVGVDGIGQPKHSVLSRRRLVRRVVAAILANEERR